MAIKQFFSIVGAGCDDIALLQTALAGLSKEQIVNVMASNQQMLSSKALTRAKIEEALANTGLSDAERANTAEKILNTSAAKKNAAAIIAEGYATKGLKGAVGSLGKAFSALSALSKVAIVIGALNLAIKGFNYFSQSAEEAFESYAKSKEQVESLASEIKRVSDEIKINEDRIKEIQSLGTLPSLVEEKELSDLQKSNDALERRINLLKAEKVTASQEQYGAARNLYAQMQDNIQGLDNTRYLRSGINNRVMTAKGFKQGFFAELQGYSSPVSAVEYFDLGVDRYDKLLQKQEEGIKLTNAEKSEYDNLAASLPVVANWYRQLAEIEPVTQSDVEMVDFANDALDRFLEVVGSGDSVSSEAFSDVSVAAQAAALSIKDANDAIDSLQSAYTSLSGAVEEYNTKGYLTLDTLQSLLELEPEYLACLQTENGQLVLNKNAMIDLAYARIDDAEAAYLQEATNLLKTFEDQEKAATYLKDVTYDLASARLADADASWKQAIANAAVSDKGSEFDAAVEKLNAHVEKQRKLFDLARASVGTYSLSVMDGGKAAESAAKAAEKAAKKMKEAAKDAQSAIEDLIDVTVKMIKHRLEAKKSAYQDDLDRIKKQYDEEKDAIEDQIDAYKRLIDARKKALERDKDENDYQKQLAEKNKEIADIESKLLEIQNDDSADAMKKRLELQEQLAGKYSDLEDYQSDRAYDQATDLLDDEYERYELIHKEKLDNLEEEYKADEEYYERKIRLIEEALDQEGSMRIEAIDMIQERSSEYYNSLIEFCTTYGGMTRDEVIHVWNDAYKSLENFGFGEKTVYDILQYLIAATCDMYAETGNVSVAMDSVAGATQRVEDGVNRVNDSLDTTIRKAKEAADAIDRVNDYSKYNNVKYKDLSGSGYDYSTVRITDPRTYPGFSSGARSLPGFASGGVVSSTGPAMLHGSSTRSEVVLSSMQGRKLLDFVENLPVVSSLLPKLNSVRGINGIRSLSTGLSIDGGLINIQVAGSLDESVVPSIKKIADRVVEQLNKTASNRGIRGNAKKGII